MERTIYNYALIKSLYDHGCDFLDCFLPLVLSAIPENNFVDSMHISDQIRTKYGLEMPAHVLESLIKKAGRQMLIEQKEVERMCRLSEKGKKRLNKLRGEQDVERHINSFLADMETFFRGENVKTTREDIYSNLLTFLNNNIRYLKEFINPEAPEGRINAPKFESNEQLIIDYIKNIQHEKPEQFNTFKEMVYGSIISTVLYSKTSSDAYEIINKKFKKCSVFLDTNFIFSLLDLHPPEYCTPVKELFNLLKKFGFEIKVFSFTINEIASLINGYANEQHKYTQHIKVNTIYSHLKRKGWSITEAQEFIINIDSILLNLGIEIEWIPETNLKNVKLKHENLKGIISIYKPDQHEFSRNHDLLAIETIEKIRRIPVRRIEDSRAFFLSSDIRLGKFDFIELGHKENNTVCEVIVDRLLTNILWLKDPNFDLPLKTIIAAHTSDLFVNRRVWNKFYEILHNLKIGSKISDEKVAMLIYHHDIENVLREYDVEDISNITPEFVLEQAEEAARAYDNKKKEDAQTKEKEFIELLSKEVSRVQDEKDKQWLNKIEEIKYEIRKGAERWAGGIIKIAKVIVTLAIVILMFGIPYKYGWELFTKLSEIVGVVLLIPVLNAFSFEKVWEKWANKLITYKYFKQLKTLKIAK